MAEDKTTQTTLASGTVNRNDEAAKSIDIADLSAYTYLILNITKGSDNQIWADHVDWVNTIFTGEGGEAPVTLTQAEFDREGVDAVNPPPHPHNPAWEPWPCSPSSRASTTSPPDGAATPHR